jgi:phosphotransferase system HPr-like phosphotransfer protein
MYTHNNPNRSKVSPEFAARLNRLQPQQKVHVIVLLDVQDAEKFRHHRPANGERKAAMEAIRKSAQQALEHIGDIIRNFDGQKLAEVPDVLGSIPLEISAEGVNALAASDAVKAVIEDQTIHMGNNVHPMGLRLRV